MKATSTTLVAIGFLLAACSDNSSSLSPHRSADNSSGAASAGSSTATTTSGPVGPSCPTGVAAPTTLGTDANAADLALAGGSVYFRVGSKLVKVNKDGTGRADVYTSKTLVRAFTDGTTVVAVENDDPLNATVHVAAVGDDPANGQDVGTNLVAAGTDVFGSDQTNAYAASAEDDGDTIYKVAKENAGGLDAVVQTKGVVSDPQVVSGVIWYVLDQTQVYKLAPGDDTPTPSLVATVDGGCSLAVGANQFFCTTNGVVQARDLTGANVQKVADAQSSKVPIAFGPGVAAGDVVVARSTGDGPYKNVLRSLGSAGEHVVACGRDTIGTIAVDATSVAWLEPGGVFIAPR